jgi:hypothetical protein
MHGQVPSIMTSRPLFLCAAALFFLVASAAAQQPAVSFSAANFTMLEKEPYRGFQIMRTGDLSGTTSIRVHVIDAATGQARNDVTFLLTKGQIYTSFSLSEFGFALDDPYYDPGRKYVATIVNVFGGTIGTPSSADIDVVDDEAPPQLIVSDITVSESSSTALFHFGMTTPLLSSVSVPIVFHDGSAKAGSEYQISGHTVTFPPGLTTETLAVNIVSDNQPEGDKSFSIELGAPSNSAVIVVKNTATCTILDDDGAVGPTSQRFTLGSKGVIHIQLTDPAPATETVLLQAIGANLTCPSSVDIPAGSSSADVEIGATETGLAAVNVTLPPSRGGRTFRCDVLVYEDVQLSLQPIGVTLAPGATVNVTAKIDPPPRTSFTADLSTSDAAVANIPRSIVVQGAETIIPVRGRAVGVTQVTMTLPDGYNYKSERFVADVRVPPGLAITSLSQTSGRASGGETVKIFGNELAGACVVTFGGVPSQNGDAPAQGAINAVTPPHDPGIVDIAVRCGSNVYTVPNAFTYTAAPLVLQQVSPASGAARGGTIVTISGINLRGGVCAASFGGAPAHAIAWNGTASMTVAAPQHGAGSVPVTLACGGDTATLAGGFNYLAADDTSATISFASPLRAAPGDLVTIRGARFRLDDVISFGTTAASDSVSPSTSDSRVVIVPEMPLGVFPLSLRDAAGRTVTGPSIEIVAPAAPAISSMPAQLTAGAEFIVTGNGFRGALTYALGPAVVQPLSIVPTRAVFRVPSLAPGPYSFTISDQSGPLASRPADVTSSGLAVTSVEPPCSAREGGTLATISGSGFENGAMVKFGTTYSADVARHDGFTLSARVPPAFGGGNPILTVINPNGTAATLTGAFVYKGAAEGGCVPPRRRAAGK